MAETKIKAYRDRVELKIKGGYVCRTLREAAFDVEKAANTGDQKLKEVMNEL